ASIIYSAGAYGLFVLFSKTAPKDSDIWLFAYVVAGCGLLLLARTLQVEYRRRWWCRKLFRQTRRAREETEVTFSNEGARWEYEDASVNYFWNDFRKWSESKEFFFFHQNDRQALVIPKDALSHEEVGLIRLHTRRMKKAW
ncbi:MAG: YcxB family protein, partial [Verrucomicrobiota bacterium]